MSPLKKSSRDLKRADSDARRVSLSARPLIAASAALVTAAALACLCAALPTSASGDGEPPAQVQGKPEPGAETSRPLSVKVKAEPAVIVTCPNSQTTLVYLYVYATLPADYDLKDFKWETDVGKTLHWNLGGKFGALWDVYGVNPGTHKAILTITSSTAGTSPIRRQVQVEVRPCPQTGGETPVSCPNVKLDCPRSVTAGQPLTFNSSLGGNVSDAGVAYKWSLPPGVTFSGEGTPSVKVDTNNLGGQDVVASLAVVWHGQSCGGGSCTVHVNLLSPTDRPGNENGPPGATVTATPPPAGSPTPKQSPPASGSPVPTAAPEHTLTPSPSDAAETRDETNEQNGSTKIIIASLIMLASLIPAFLYAKPHLMKLAARLFGGAGSTPTGLDSAGTGGIAIAIGGLQKEADEVQCTVFSPPRVSPGDSFLVQVFAHLATQLMQVVSMARAADADAKQRDSVELDNPIERGQELVFELTMRGLEVQEPTTMRLVWKGKPKSVKFDVQVPEDCQPKSVTGTVDIYYLNVPIGNLRFKLHIVPRGVVESAAERPSFPEQKFKLYRYAFISYASEDRAEVLRRVQVLPLVRIDYFQDITSLDPGDRWEKELYREIDKSDVFFLFWSKAASRSEWVEKEVLYAIERKHGEEEAAPDIKPVMLEGPPPVEPPDSLRSLHFNDRMLYFISVEDSLRAARNEREPPGDVGAA